MNEFLEGIGDAPETKPGGGQANPPHRILIVEGHRDLQQGGARVLTDSGYAVDLAEDGSAAWEALSANRYDLLITDNPLASRAGIELVKKLRSARMGLPIIMAAATVPTQELAVNPWLEPVATLRKPYDTSRLLEVVKGILNTGLSNGNHSAKAPKYLDTDSFSVERYSTERKLEWDRFVTTAKNATFLFLRDYMDYHQDRFLDHSLMIFKDQALVAVLPANLDANGSLISHEGLTFGGLVLLPAAKLGEVLACFSVLLHYLSQNKISKLFYKRIPAFYSTLTDDDVAYALFLVEARLYRRDCSVAISQSHQVPLRTNHKRLVKRATRAGVQIIQETNFRPFWERVLTPQLFARYGVKPVHTLEEITLLAGRFPANIKQFSAYSGDEILSGTTIYETPTVAHSQYAAVTEKGRECGAQAYLFSRLIERYKDKEFFDFGISNEEEGRALNHGLLDWKEGFGARCRAHDFYEIATANYLKLQPVLLARPKKMHMTPTSLNQRSTTVRALASAGRVAIRRFELSDAPLLYEAVCESLPNLCSTLTWCREDYSQEQAMTFLRGEAAAWHQGNRHDFAIFDTQDGSFLGSIGFSHLDRRYRSASIGYWVRTSRLNQGVGRQAILLAARYALEQLETNRIEFVIARDNAPSLHAANAVGARQEGVLREKILLKGIFHDAILLSLLRSDMVSLSGKP